MQLNIATLSNLTPQTVIAIGDAGFNRLLALPGVQEVREGSTYGRNIDDTIAISTPDGEDDISASEVTDLTSDSEIRLVIHERYALYGVLNYDQDCGNPLEECDGEGKIYHRGRRASRSEETEFNRAMGLDAYGDRDYASEPVLRAQAELVLEDVRQDRGLFQGLAHLLRRYTPFAGTLHFVSQALTDACVAGGTRDDVRFAFTGKYSDHRLQERELAWVEQLAGMIESCQERAWEHAFKQGKLGIRHSRLIDIYEHGGVSYSLAGTGMNCSFDTTRGGAIWVPDDLAMENILGHVRHQQGLPDDTPEESLDQALLQKAVSDYAKGCIEQYDDWRNGNCYSLSIRVIDRTNGEVLLDHDHDCCGMIGSTYAEDRLEHEMANLVLQLISPRH